MEVFLKAMKFILKKMKGKTNRKAIFVCSLSYKNENKKIITAEGRLKGKFHSVFWEKRIWI